MSTYDRIKEYIIYALYKLSKKKDLGRGIEFGFYHVSLAPKQIEMFVFAAPTGLVTYKREIDWSRSGFLTCFRMIWIIVEFPLRIRFFEKELDSGIYENFESTRELMEENGDINISRDNR
jgi:hypothetical protein